MRDSHCGRSLGAPEIRRAGRLVIHLATAALGAGGDEPQRSEPGRGATEPLRGSIHLRIDNPADPRRRNLRLDEAAALPVKAHDRFRIKAKLNRKAYLYVFWIGSDGKLAPLYPGKDHDWTRRPDREDKVKGIELPEIIDETMVLPPAAPGLETLVLLAREDSPLPRDADTALERDLAGPSTTRLPDGMTEAIWLENGQVFGLDERGQERTAPGPRTRRTDDPVLRIRETLRKKLPSLGDYHRAVIVPNQGGP
jgi:hypothetical protein